MIVKKVKNPQKAASKATRIGRLTAYIVNPEREHTQEKCLYAGARGFLCDDLPSQQAEMLALSQEAVRSKDTINHYVLSWREGEQPSPAQVEEAVGIFLETLGMPEHQAIYGLHADTDNLHVHLAINRVHPETLRVIRPNQGFDIEAAHQAIARIEQVQGWQREAHGRYQVLENGVLGREARDPTRPRQPDQPKRDMEHRTGEKSAERLAIENGAPIIKRAQTWAQLHRELAEHGMRYEKTGSGATLFVGEVGVKASSADRTASLSQVQKRLGPYEPAPAPQRVAARGLEPLTPSVPGWQDYITGRHAHEAAKVTARVAQQQQQEAERQELTAQQKQQRDVVLQGRWHGRGELRNALQSVLAAAQAVEKAALQERHQREREMWRQHYRPYPDLEQWQRQQQHPERAEQWRHRTSEPQRLEGPRYEAPTPDDIHAYASEIVGQVVHYTRKEDAGTGRGVSFVDTGAHIDVYDWHHRDTTLAAMQLAAHKWGRFQVMGNDPYQALCVTLAAEHGLTISNPALQERLGQEMQRLQHERGQALSSAPMQQFARYHEAVGAERYRVTSLRTREDGSTQTFLLDTPDGRPPGWTPQEMAQRMPDMQRMHARGETLYYTPLSATQHHLLIDTMSKEQLDHLVQDGYRPAVVLESHPGTYQALMTVPKLGTSHDQEVGHRLAERLNQQYGDPALSGGMHPHLAPGYAHHMAPHVGADGSAPEVRLVQAERRECVQTLALSAQMDAEYQQQAVEPARQAPPVLEQAPASGRTIDAYQRHHRDVLTRHEGGVVDLSRVDAVVAVRLRVTGHTQDEIAGAVRQCAPTTRPQEEDRDWNAYAQRTARYAFSAAGDRHTAMLDKYRAQWEKLEGRELVQQMQERAGVEVGMEGLGDDVPTHGATLRLRDKDRGSEVGWGR